MTVATIKVLGQLMPAAGVLSSLYAVPKHTSASVSTLMVCNQSSSVTGKVRVSVAIGGVADALAQYIYYDLTIAPNNSFAASLDITLAAGDQVRIWAEVGVLSFNLFGTEYT